MDKVPMTVEGYKKLETELHRLKVEERPRIIQQIADAREHGDLAENAEYHAAKEAQGLNEARVADLEDKLSRAEVIDPSKLSGNTVKFGATVALEDEESGDKVKYKIVGEHEASVRDGKISISSPIARALIGKSIQDRGRARGQCPRRQDFDQLADRQGTDRQVEGRDRRGDDAQGRAQLRDPENRIQVGWRGGIRAKANRLSLRAAVGRAPRARPART